MIGKTKYILIFLMPMIFTGLSAQNSQILYFMNLPQNHLSNPALRPSNSLYIGLPVISGINVNINNSFVNFADVFIKDQPSGEIITFLHPDYNVDDFLTKIKDKNFLMPQAAVQLFGLGFSAGKDSYFFLDINERLEGNVVLPGDLFKLVLKGNERFIGSEINLSSLKGDLKYYREVGLGFSKNFTNKLRIGVKAKLLLGIAGASIDNRSLGITVSDDYTHTLNADFTFNTSGLFDTLQIFKDETRINALSKNRNDFLNPKNIGLGIDIGAEYNITDRLLVSAAVTDIGFIKWKTEVLNLRAKSKFEFSGLDMFKVFNGTISFDSLANQMVDSLKNSFTEYETSVPFTTYLPFGVTLGGSYNLTKSFSLGLLSYSRVIGKQIRESLTLSANLNLGNAFSASLGYTASNNRYDNLGAGLAFRAGIVQFYMLTDRIPLTWDKIKTDNKSIPLPTSWNTINLRLGMNLVFGNRIRNKGDKPMVQVE